MRKHVMIDIEALGLRPGSAIVELGAVEFYPRTGWVGTTFFERITPCQPLTADMDTLAWHAAQRTWPPPELVEPPVVSLRTALNNFGRWYDGLGEVTAVWSWGATYDFPLLQTAYDHYGTQTPWKYYQAQCARTIWSMVFPDLRHSKRPHQAVEDAKMGAEDLIKALIACDFYKHRDSGI